MNELTPYARKRLAELGPHTRPAHAITPAERAALEAHSRDNAEAIERASARDRRYFERHPAELAYFRPAIAGELPGAERGDLVYVEQLQPGARVRRVVRKGAGR